MNVYKNKIYLFGGIHDLIYELSDAHVFDINTKKWDMIEDSS